MQLKLTDNTLYNIDILDSPVWRKLQQGFKHLQHIDIPYKPWDNPLYFKNTKKHQQLVERIFSSAIKLGFNLDKEQLINKYQSYYNEIHEIYEKNYDGNPEWMIFHECIHELEKDEKNITESLVYVDWREKANLLQTQFTWEMHQYQSTRYNRGDVFVEWNELGKKPYRYWSDKEPENVDRVLELCKPWINLKPVLTISLEDHDELLKDSINSLDFNLWWKQYSDAFCKKYNVPYYNLEQQCGVVKIGTLSDVDNFAYSCMHGAYPKNIKL